MISEIHDSVLTDAGKAALDLFGDLLATELLEKATGFRNGSFPLPVMFWIFLCQLLAGGSCRYDVASVQALFSIHASSFNVLVDENVLWFGIAVDEDAGESGACVRSNEIVATLLCMQPGNHVRI